MNSTIRFVLCIVATINLSGCLYGQCIDGPCALERAKIIENIKPYGAHWVKEGMTREIRVTDWLECGGSSGLNDGYERRSGITTKDYFEGLDLRLKQIRQCMDGKNYLWIEKCDDRCMYP